MKEKLSAGVSEKWAKALLFLVEADPSSNTSHITDFELEHIAPQSANDDWRKALNLEGAEYSSKVRELGNLTQFAIIREAHGIVAELSQLTNLGPIAQSIAKSGRYLSMTMTLMVLFSVGLIGTLVFVIL